jgi:hypothetical protein
VPAQGGGIRGGGFGRLRQTPRSASSVARGRAWPGLDAMDELVDLREEFDLAMPPRPRFRS